MFTATEFRVMREKCPTDLSALLGKLNIPVPNWENGDEFRISSDLDDAITGKLSQMMKSDSVIDGYMELLTLGKVAFDYSETDTALLDKAVNHRDVIVRGATEQKAQVKTMNAQSANEPPRKNVRRVEQTEMSTGALVAGGVVIAAGVGAIAMGTTGVGIIALVAGGASVANGIKGRKVVREVVVEAPQAARKAAAPVNSAAPAPFTVNEIQQVFDVLTLANKIVKSI